MHIKKIGLCSLLALSTFHVSASNKIRLDSNALNRNDASIIRNVSNPKGTSAVVPLIKAVAGGLGNLKRTVFTSSQSWAVPAGVSTIRVLLVAGGGGGAAAQHNHPTGCTLESTYNTYYYCMYNWARAGSGGGSGQIVDAIVDITDVTSLPIVVGAGGASAAVAPTEAYMGNGGAMGGSSYIGSSGQTYYRIAYGGAGGDRNDATYGYMAGGHGFAGGGGAPSIYMTDSTGLFGLGGVTAHKPYTSYRGVSPVGAHGSTGLQIANTTTNFQYASVGSGGGGYYGQPADDMNLSWDQIVSKIVEFKSSGSGGIGYWGRGGRGGEGSVIPFASNATKYASTCGEGMGFGAGGAGGYITDTLAAGLVPALPTPYKGGGGGGGFIPDDYYPTGSLASIMTCGDFRMTNQNGTAGKQGIVIVEWVE